MITRDVFDKIFANSNDSTDTYFYCIEFKNGLLEYKTTRFQTINSKVNTFETLLKNGFGHYTDKTFLFADDICFLEIAPEYIDSIQNMLDLILSDIPENNEIAFQIFQNILEYGLNKPLENIKRGWKAFADFKKSQKPALKIAKKIEKLDNELTKLRNLHTKLENC